MRVGFPSRHSSSFPIVGIGASAGGLDAFSQLLRRLPTDTGMAFVFIQHLSRDHVSLLTELLSKATSMPVAEARNGTPIKPNHIYLIPPNTGMIISHRTLYLHRRRPAPALGLPIDEFFLSLAQDLGSQAIGVILSGNASDGSIGLKAIKEAGGITFVQNEASAKFTEMPHNAVEAGGADKILRPSQIAVELERIGQNTYMKIAPKKKDSPLPFTEDDLQNVFILLKKAVGVDYRHYRQSTLHRRIQRRMLLQGAGHLQDYLQRLERDPAEVLALSEDMLIHTTEFFRDPTTFRALERSVFRHLTHRRAKDQALRIWVPGCSTGQEVYSIAISLAEFESRRHLHFPLRIFASDLNEATIQKARRGIYTPHEMSGISPQRMQRFFSKVEGGYQVAKSIREQCVFAKQDIVHDPPFSRIDLISCRNVLIYLEPMWQNKTLSLFHYALGKNGALLLGPAEPTPASFLPFPGVEKSHRLYIKNPRSSVVKYGWTFPSRSASWRETSHRPADKPTLLPDEHSIEKTLETLELAIKKAPKKAPWRKDVADTLGHIQAILEDQERAAEEMQSNHEELQSTNEELETAKEELQSGNEELLTLSDEIQTRNTELTRINDDLGNLLASVRLPLLMIGNDLRIRRITYTAKIFGFVESDIGKPITDFLKQLPIPDIEQIVANVKQTVTPIEREMQDSSGNWYLMQVNPYRTAADVVEGAILTFLDIDVRKRNEVRMQELRDFSAAIAETAREPLVVLHEDFRVKAANRSFYLTYQLAPDQVVGCRFYELAERQWDNAKLRLLLQDVLAKKIPIVDVTVEHDFPGLGRKVLIVNARVLDRPGTEPELLLSLQDVTASRNLQEMLIRSGKMSAVGKLAAGIAHELNNPLTVILGSVQSEIRHPRPHDEDFAAILKTIERETIRCARLVQDLLSFAKTRPTGRNLEHVGALLQQALSLVETQAKLNHVKILLKIEKELPQIPIDRDQFTQVVINLCTNALDAMPRGGTLTVDLVQNNDTLELHVKDTGSGIPADVLGQIFDPFFTTKGVGKGTGLGLSLAYEIIKNHSGYIDVDSEVGKGSTFTILLPISTAKPRPLDRLHAVEGSTGMIA